METTGWRGETVWGPLILSTIKSQISSFYGIIQSQMLIQRAMNVFVISLASSTRPSSSMSWTLPRIPDSKAEATKQQSAISILLK